MRTDDEYIALGRAVEKITADWVVVAEIYRRANVQRAVKTFHADTCDGNDDWHHPISGHCGGCDCITCGQER